MGIIEFLLGLGCLQGVILASVLVAAPRGPRLANVFMAALVLAISSRLLHMWLVVSGNYLSAGPWALMIEGLPFAWGPLLYLYACALMHRSISWKQTFHLIPFASILLTTYQYLGYDAASRQVVVDYLWYNRGDPELEAAFRQLVSPLWFLWLKYRLHGYAFALHFAVYCMLVIQRIKQHNLLLERHFSSLDKLNLRWLRMLTAAGSSKSSLGIRFRTINKTT